MIPKAAVEKAIEGGWTYRGGAVVFWQQTGLDPFFWQALGKALEWTRTMAQVFPPDEPKMFAPWMAVKNRNATPTTSTTSSLLGNRQIISGTNCYRN